jgi:hypothetical protein
MSKDELAALIVEIIEELKNIESFRCETSLGSIIVSYEKNLDSLMHGKSLTDLMGGSPRAYLEIYSDYENPVLGKMDLAQKELQKIIGKKP